MKKTILTILILAFCVSISGAGITDKLRAVIAAKNAGGGAPTCGSTPYIDQPTVNDNWALASSDIGPAYAGQGDLDPGADKTICRVDFNIYSITDDISAINWVAEIYNMDGDNLGTAATGDCVSDANIITGTGFHASAQFTGLACEVTNTNLYAIVLTRQDHGYGDANINYAAKTTNDAISGNEFEWFIDKLYVTDREQEMGIKIYVLE